MTPAPLTRKLLIPPLAPAAPGALYQQIIDSLRREISEGRLPAGTPLPSFRGLAQDLLVSVITVKRAYEELERDGIIYRRQGLGTFVAEAAGDRSRAANIARARDLLTDALRAGADAGLTGRQVAKLLDQIIQQGGPHHAVKRA